MKKLLILLIVFVLFGCSNADKVEYTYEIQSEKVDMSAYKGVNSTNHQFRLITPSELFNCIDNKSSGVFYLGRDNCGCCQKICRYLNETASELGVTIYYIDVFNEKEPLTIKANQDKLYEYMNEILGIDDSGEKVLLTPHVFSVVNGKFYDSLICYDGLELDTNPSDQQIKLLKDKYRNIMKPFINKSS